MWQNIQPWNFVNFQCRDQRKTGMQQQTRIPNPECNGLDWTSYFYWSSPMSGLAKDTSCRKVMQLAVVQRYAGQTRRKIPHRWRNHRNDCLVAYKAAACTWCSRRINSTDSSHQSLFWIFVDKFERYLFKKKGWSIHLTNSTRYRSISAGRLIIFRN